MSEYLYTTPPVDRSVGTRRHIMTTAMGVFGGWGYREIQVPLLHYFDALRPGLDDAQVERSFRFVDRGGNLMMLRPDVTPAIAQNYAWQMRNVSLPLRVSYTHKVVRLERSLRRNQLESYQLGIEHIGGDELIGDLEILLMAIEVLNRLSFSDIQVRLGDHQVATYLLKSSGAPARIQDDIRQALIARDAHEVRSLLDRLGTREAYAKAIMALVSLRGGRTQIDALREVFPYDRQLNERLDYLSSILQTLDSLGVGECVHLELAELGGASYYTGIGFSLISGNASKELGRGGRYDELIGAYGKPTRAVGFSLSLEMLVQGLAMNNIQGVDEDNDSVLYSPVDTQNPADGFAQILEARRNDRTIRVSARSKGGRG